MESTIERRIALQGSTNFRDIGGYATRSGATTRWKRLYRSDALARLTDDDIMVLTPLQMATLIDLRSAQELETSGPSRLVSEYGVAHRHMPFLPESTNSIDPENIPPLSELYVLMVERGAPTIRTVFDALADNTTYPAVVHCTAGKDRTGVTIALLLRTLGVSDEVIVADYALTDGYLAEGIERLRAAGLGEQYSRVPPALLRAHAETMAGFLATVDARFGGTDKLLADVGVLPGTQEEIRQHLLERL